MLSSRGPYVYQEGGWQPTVGGLTAALGPVMRRQGGTWLSQGTLEPQHLFPSGLGYQVRCVEPTPEDRDLAYNGASNGTLWPLCHGFLDRVTYSAPAWEAYRRVNQQFAQTAARLHQSDTVVWIHDYQLALVPGMLRDLKPGARSGLFWHIPWPSVDMLMTLPWREELLRGVLSADVVGLHTRRDADKLARAAEAVLGAQITNHGLQWQGREVTLLVDPISVDTTQFERARVHGGVIAAAQALKAELGGTLVLSVDRLDYSKGLPQRLLAFERYLERHPESHGNLTFMQVACPSRDSVGEYQAYRLEVEALVGRINGRYSSAGWVPVRYLGQQTSKEDLAVYYRAADVMWVTPLRDGLNLVAKEFVCASEDGALILSEFAGAAEELTEALIVNPYDEEAMVETLQHALTLPHPERLKRIGQLRRRVQTRTVHLWAEDFLNALQPALTSRVSA
ncbi:trehalose 6-phosphate synthase/phosphatase [Deinococcus sp. UYEF24]